MKRVTRPEWAYIAQQSTISMHAVKHFMVIQEVFQVAKTGLIMSNLDSMPASLIISASSAFGIINNSCCPKGT